MIKVDASVRWHDGRGDASKGEGRIGFYRMRASQRRM